MAVRLEGAIQRWVGLSTDSKPDHQTTTIPAGSSFMESDTGRIHRSSGAAWVVWEPVDEHELLLNAILQELVQMRAILEYPHEVRASELVPA